MNISLKESIMENNMESYFTINDVELPRLRGENEKLKKQIEELVKNCKYLEEENKRYRKLNDDVWEQAKQWIQEDTKVIKSLEMSNILLRRKVQMYEYEKQCKINTEGIIPEVSLYDK